MSLSCSCDYDWGDWEYYYEHPADYRTYESKRAKRCLSCGTMVKKGDLCIEFGKVREPNSDIEERIYGEGPTVYLASQYHCERCADLYFSLDELGFCVNPGDSMLELVKEYAQMRKEGGFK